LQVLASLKHKIDQFLSKHNNVDLLVEQARLFLISREDKLVNARKNALEAAAQSSVVKRHSLTSESFSRGIIYFINILEIRYVSSYNLRAYMFNLTFLFSFHFSLLSIFVSHSNCYQYVIKLIISLNILCPTHAGSI